MDFVLSKVTQQAMNYAIRSGITITSAFALEQCARLLKTTRGEEREELGRLQRRLESKIRIISPAIDMIELIAARGNTSLESAVSLAKSIRWNIQSLGVRLKSAAEIGVSTSNKPRTAAKAQAELELQLVVKGVRTLLERIEDAVPLINLAITTSGVSLSTNLPASISPSRLLQASTLLTAGDTRYAIDTSTAVTIGPAFIVSMYMLFGAHAHQVQDEEQLRASTWKEVMHKAKLKLVRVPLHRVDEFPFPDSAASPDTAFTDAAEAQLLNEMGAEKATDEYAYQLAIIEDLDDDRMHDFEEENLRPAQLDDVSMAGIREAVPIHEISKIFYADTGKILNIGSDGETNNPVLLLKRDVNAAPPRRMMDRDDAQSVGEESDKEELAGNVDKPVSNDEVRTRSPTSTPNKHPWQLPPDLDPEWIALEVYNEEMEFESDSDTADEDSERTDMEDGSSPRTSSAEPALSSALSRLKLQSSHPSSVAPRRQNGHALTPRQGQSPFATPGPVKTSLSLLEMLIRLTSLQQFQQTSHLAITDELLNFFLEESSTTGAPSGDAEARRRIRRDARDRVGFDPYDESPVKRRGEEYQRQHGNEWDAEYQEQWEAERLPSSSEQPPGSPQSPLLLRSREHSSRSRSGTPARSEKRSSPLPGGRDYSTLATPPNTTKSRRAFLRDEEARERGSGPVRSSPLAKDISAEGK